MSPFTFIGNRIDMSVRAIVGRDALKRGNSAAAHRDDTSPHLFPRSVALQRGGRNAEQPIR